MPSSIMHPYHSYLLTKIKHNQPTTTHNIKSIVSCLCLALPNNTHLILYFPFICNLTKLALIAIFCFCFFLSLNFSVNLNSKLTFLSPTPINNLNILWIFIYKKMLFETLIIFGVFFPFHSLHTIIAFFLLLYTTKYIHMYVFYFISFIYFSYFLFANSLLYYVLLLNIIISHKFFF